MDVLIQQELNSTFENRRKVVMLDGERLIDKTYGINFGCIWHLVAHLEVV